MGLDWNPIGKPKMGYEEEFIEIYNLLNGSVKNDSILNKMKNLFVKTDEDKLKERWFDIQISPFETINAPQVGIDVITNKWAEKQFNLNKDKYKSLDEFISDNYGYYVVELAKASPGIPLYSNGSAGYVEYFSFRGEFLVNDCKDILPFKLIDECYNNHLSKELAMFSNNLYEIAKNYSIKNNIEHIENIFDVDYSEKSNESKAHILFSAAKWGMFWSENGHGNEAYI
jgi:hypothetical protein